MSETIRRPEDGGSGGDQNWVMEPNNDQELPKIVVADDTSTELAVVNNGTAQSTELAVVENPTEIAPVALAGGGDGGIIPPRGGETAYADPEGDDGDGEEDDDSDSETGAEGGENGEDGESELDRALGNNYTSDIFKAARKIGKPVENAMDIFDWSDEDKQRLLDALASPVDAEGEGEGNGSAETGTDNGGENGTAKAPESNDSETSDKSDADDEDDEAARIAAAAVAAAAAGNNASAAGGGNIPPVNNGGEMPGAAENSGDNKEKKKRSPGFKKKVAAAILTLAVAAGIGGMFMGNSAKNVKESTAITQEQEDDQEDNESIASRSTYRGMFASEDGSTYNQEKFGNHNFGESLGSGLSEDEMRQELGDRMIQPGQLAATYYYMQEKTTDPNFGVEGANFDNPDALLEAMEEDADLHQAVYDYVMSIFNAGSFTENTVSGTYHNFFMDSAFETGDADTSNIEVVGCTTNEDGTKVYTVRHVWMDDNKVEHTDTYTFKERCGGQPLDQMDFTTTVRQIPEDPTPDKPTPDKPDPDDPDPDGPTPNDEKKPFVQEQVDEGLDGLHVDPQDQNGDVSEQRPEMSDYNPETNSGDTSGAVEHHDEAPNSDEMVGAQDPNEQSGDGSGRTVAEVVEQAEEDGGAGGENTSGQVSRTEEDAAQQASDAAGAAAQAEANANEDRSAGDASASMTDEEAASAFANGDF